MTDKSRKIFLFGIKNLFFLIFIVPESSSITFSKYKQCDNKNLK